MHRIIFVAAIVAVTLASGLASMGLFSRTPVASAVAPSAGTTGYIPTAGFEYYPAQYRNQATKIEDHVENF